MSSSKNSPVAPITAIVLVSTIAISGSWQRIAESPHHGYESLSYMRKTKVPRKIVSRRHQMKVRSKEETKDVMEKCFD